MTVITKVEFLLGGTLQRHLLKAYTQALYPFMVFASLSSWLSSTTSSLDVWQTDIGNTYLKATPQEKVYVVAGPEFEDIAGHVFVIHKALVYGLKTSGLRWHESFAGVLRDMEFLPCPAEPDIWMKDCGDHYAYIAVYCDDLTIASKNP